MREQRTGPSAAGVRLPGSAARRLLARYDPRAAVVLLFALPAATSYGLQSLTLGALVSSGARRIDALAAFVWAAVAVGVLARRRLGRPDGVLFVALATGCLTVTGVLCGRQDLRWLSIAVLMVVPLVAVTFFSWPGVLAAAAASLSGSTTLLVENHDPVLVLLTGAGGLVCVTFAPALVFVVLLHRLHAARDDARRLAVTDQLTGLLNRRGMREGAGAAVAAALTAGNTITVMVADLDDFKSINDTFGHDSGDRVLAAVAGTLALLAREGDLVVRLGGEELAWVAHFPSPVDAERAAERARAAIAGLSVSGLPAVTVSIGLATAVPVAGLEAERVILGMLSCADKALYEAKRSGRNRAVRAAAPCRELPAAQPTGERPETART